MAIDRVEIQIAPARKEGRIMIERWTNEARRHAGEFARTGNWRAYKYSLMTVLALKLRINEAKTQKLVERVNPETFFARLGRVMQKQSANSAPVDSTIATSSDEQPPQQQLRTTTRKREVKKQPARRELSVVGMVSPMLEGHERTILSYLLNGHGGAREFLHRVAERIFSNPIHGTILHAIRDVFDQGDEVNFITVSNRLDEMKALANCGGQGGIVEISNETSSAEIVESALECVLEAYQERETIRIGERLHSGEITGEQAVAQLQSIEQISEPSELPPPPSPYKPPPLDLLPSVLQDFVHAVAESINVDVGFTFLPTLSAVGTAIGNSRSILLKRGFVQPPVIWSAIIARSGGRKHPTTDATTFAITEHERELIQQNEEAMEIYNEQLADWNSQSKKARGEKPTRPTFLTCYTDDLTFESLGELAVMNPRGFIVRKDELSHWFASFDQYKDAKGSDVARWLTLHSAFPLAVDRRTDRRHYRIMNPRVCITGGIQPKILRRVLTPEYFERGLPARFIFDYPPFRQDRWNNTSVPEKLRTQVLKLFEQLWLLQPTGSNPFLLTFEPDAKALFIDFYNQCGESALEAGEHEEGAPLGRSRRRSDRYRIHRSPPRIAPHSARR